MSAEAPNFSTDLLVDGARVAGAGDPISCFDPSTGEVTAQIPRSTAAQVEGAIAAARRAFDEGPWGRSNPKDRAAALNRLADAVAKRRNQFVDLVVQEVGTPVSYAGSFQVDPQEENLRWYADAALLDRDVQLPPIYEPMPSASTIRYVPAGVVAGITAFNLPLQFPLGKAGAALAAGCTFVLMPSSLTPLCSFLLAECFQEADLPPGTVNIVLGEAEVGRMLSEHPAVDKVTFTGSVAVGSQVMAQAAGTIKGVTLELGGKSPSILLPDVDFDQIMQGVHFRYARNTGQGCTCPSRILVPAERFDEFVEATRRFWPALEGAVGDPRDPATLVGPVIRPEALARIEGYVRSALDEGGEIIAGGGRPDIDRGWWHNPTLIAGVGNESRICREEIFGPVSVAMPYSDVEEAIRIGNETTYGLGAHVWGRDQRRCMEVAKQLRAGSVYINGGGGARPDVSFGGFRQSGIGREFGELGIRDLLESQHIQWTF